MSVSGDVCIVNGGQPIASGDVSVTFKYAWPHTFPLMIVFVKLISNVTLIDIDVLIFACCSKALIMEMVSNFAWNFLRFIFIVL